ncbi:hypothetical protein GALL_395610 [mine drainage metagenome]|uniref:Peptidase C39-like domain-containing protein n=1 Tax=mine drainage metagenome TaxID=410659 RepID=A0A1J5QFI3_9ZZZZ
MGARAYGAYSDEPGQPEGLIYQPFVNYVNDVHHFYAEVVTQLTSARLCAEIEDGRLVIASVNSEIRRPHLIPPPRSGGHLVLVTAAGAETVTFHDPAGHRPEAIVATLPMMLFDRFSAGRGVTLKLD